MRLLPRAAIVAALSTVIALVAGCGPTPPKMVSMNGTAKHKGQPLTAGSVWLTPDTGNSYTGEKPSGQLQLDGSFTVSTFPYGQGVPPGAYKVTFTPGLASRIGKPDYGDPVKTPLKLVVPEDGLKDYVIDIK